MADVSPTDICNWALDKLGARRIAALVPPDDSVNGRACSANYDKVRRDILRDHPWNFAITRAQLPALATPPAFGRKNAFQLPSDCLRLVNDYPELTPQNRDWLVEQKTIVSNDPAPLNIRYVADLTDTTMFSSEFTDALACMLAFEMCEKITQSNTKKEALSKEYDAIVERAKFTNAIENVPGDPPADRYLTIRR